MSDNYDEISPRTEEATAMDAPENSEELEIEAGSMRDDPLQHLPASTSISKLATEEYGGGIRGYASFLMIEELMILIGDKEKSYQEKHTSSFEPCQKPLFLRSQSNQRANRIEYLPCHYFDYMIGTSTGELIATMLGRWWMSVAECRKIYKNIGGSIFKNSRLFRIMGRPRYKYSKRPLIQAINDLVDERTPGSAIQGEAKFSLFPAPGDLCRTAVFAIQKGLGTTNSEGVVFRIQDGPFIFRPYPPEVETGLGKVKLDEWKESRDDGEGGKCRTLEYIEQRTRDELLRPTVQDDLRQLASLLVAQRRRRVKEDFNRWERFACCTIYKCDVDGCRTLAGDTLSFELRREMRNTSKASTTTCPERWKKNSIIGGEHQNILSGRFESQQQMLAVRAEFK
ncbi:hypothetical protein G7Y89_g1453 [Cudoniella acicularis]|uniref:PNPLA domain-containing protein n=1 Tax=Cudoniella acicularis TaxID=354080 RepID=A0A8H4WAA1_9HELO|nr:hypothetical protein G7Y89_g1453 [Cudoniella acicularis]